MNREAIWTALFQRLGTVPGIATASRRLKHWSDVQPSAQPALFLCQKGESVDQSRGRPAAHRLRAELFVYVHESDPHAAPATKLNAILDAIETAMSADTVAGVLTLDGLVSHCWIEGQIETDEGVLGEQAVAIVPIEMSVP